jgi:hypothetical protein
VYYQERFDGPFLEWYPGLTPTRTVSWPDIDETLVVDLQATPQRVTGTHSEAETTTVLAADGSVLSCRLSAGMFFDLTLFDWPVFGTPSGTLLRIEQRVERVGVNASATFPFPYITSEATMNAIGAGENFRIRYDSFYRGLRSGPAAAQFSGNYVVDRSPSAFRDCAPQPEEWPVVQTVTNGLTVGGEYEPPYYIGPEETASSSYMRPYVSSSFLQPWFQTDTVPLLRFRRLMPYPTMTITTT